MPPLLDHLFLSSATEFRSSILVGGHPVLYKIHLEGICSKSFMPSFLCQDIHLGNPGLVACSKLDLSAVSLPLSSSSNWNADCEISNF